jgi:hypothetical protein
VTAGQPLPGVRLLLCRSLALLVAINYLGFRTELFAAEFEENHPALSNQCTFTTSSVNWETYDKDNAPKAFVFHGTIRIELLGTLSRGESLTLEFHPQYRLIQDKSPPEPSPSI